MWDAQKPLFFSFISADIHSTFIHFLTIQHDKFMLIFIKKFMFFSRHFKFYGQIRSVSNSMYSVMIITVFLVGQTMMKSINIGNSILVCEVRIFAEEEEEVEGVCF